MFPSKNTEITMVVWGGKYYAISARTEDFSVNIKVSTNDDYANDFKYLYEQNREKHPDGILDYEEENGTHNNCPATIITYHFEEPRGADNAVTSRKIFYNIKKDKNVTLYIFESYSFQQNEDSNLPTSEKAPSLMYVFADYGDFGVFYRFSSISSKSEIPSKRWLEQMSFQKLT